MLLTECDAFVSYSPKNGEWVHQWLLPRLEGAGLTLCIDTRDFEPGVPRLRNIQQAIQICRHTVMVLTTAWIEDPDFNFQFELAQYKDPRAQVPHLLPVLFEDCDLPDRLRYLTCFDFTDQAKRSNQVERLISTIFHTSGRSNIVTTDETFSLQDRSSVLELQPGNYAGLVNPSQNFPGGPAFLQEPAVANLFRAMIIQECREALSQTTIFRPKKYSNMLGNISRLGYYSGIKPEELISAEELDLPFGASVGLFYGDHSRLSVPHKRVAVALPVTMVASIALFVFLQRVRGVDLVIDYSCCNGTDVIKKLGKGGVNAAVMPVGGTSALIRQQSEYHYSPLMLMPAGSYAIMSQPSVVGVADVRSLAMPTSRPSSAVTYCDELKSMGKIARSVHYEDTEFYDTTDVLRGADADTAVAQWFPTYRLSEFLGYKMLAKGSPANEGHYSLSTFLFLREDLYSDIATRQWLSFAIRDAWLELYDSPRRLEEIVTIMLHMGAGIFPKALKRCSGITGPLVELALDRGAESNAGSR